MTSELLEITCLIQHFQLLGRANPVKPTPSSPIIQFNVLAVILSCRVLGGHALRPGMTAFRQMFSDYGAPLAHPLPRFIV